MPRAFLLFATLLLFISTPVAHAASFKSTGTQEDLLFKYRDATASRPIRILIAPGHEPGYGGAEFQGVYEREIVTEAAQKLASELRANPKFDVIVTRTNDSWNDDLGEYFQDEMRSISKFVASQKKAMMKLVRWGSIETRSQTEEVAHSTVRDDVALRLYGINLWANENDIDLVVNLHVNDTTDHGPNTPSKYSGYTVYVPDRQYGNAEASRPLGEALARRFGAYAATSTLPIEDAGVVEDQELIAIGAYNTLSAPTVLIEYSYITESKFTHPEVRSVVTDDFAYQTYLGIRDYFHDPVSLSYGTLSLPHFFSDSPKAHTSSPEAYALQATLHYLGFYPSAPRTLIDCPVSGFMGTCTMDALKAFQKSRGLEQTGSLGPKTRAALNVLSGV